MGLGLRVPHQELGYPSTARPNSPPECSARISNNHGKKNAKEARVLRTVFESLGCHSPQAALGLINAYQVGSEPARQRAITFDMEMKRPDR